ncbi:MFS general substrate transporter [Boletus edulis]|nr:MFS general substrate transporter [Boletus edulis]
MSTYRAGSETLHIEEKNLGLKGDVSTSDDLDNEFGGKEARKRLERKLLWKLDLRMSILVAIYILNYADDEGRLIETMLDPFWVVHAPSGKGPNLISTHHSFVGALLTRFFLGFVEAAFFPGALFLISKWYKRDEIGLRTAILYCGNIISNAFGALLASGILGGMNGALGHAPWRWLFYIEGALTCFVAVCAIFILPDFPASTRWLTEEERRLALRRMKEDVGVGDQGETETGGDGTWTIPRCYRLESMVTALSFNAYFPTLTATLGYNPTVTLLLVAPPFVFTVIVAFWLSRRSDKKQERFYHMICLVYRGHHWLYHRHQYYEYCGALRVTVRAVFISRIVPHGTIVCGIRGDVCVDEQLVPAPAVETCTGEYWRVICMAIQLGTIVPVFVWDMHRVYGEALRALNRELEEEDDDRGFRYIL